MVTLVGTQGDFGKAIRELVELEYDTVEAYEAAINRLENEQYKDQLSEFKNDHDRHIRDFSTLLEEHGIEVPSGPSVGKQWLAKGKVVLGNLIGDNTILHAMHSNEEDTNSAYARINNHKEKWEDAELLIFQAVEDERRHKAWIEKTLSK